MELLTLAEIAKRLGLPESTIRYYRNNFEEFIPSVGEGRTKRYTQESLEVLRFIADTVRSGVPLSEVRELLASRYAMTVQEIATTETDTQQPATILNEMIKAALDEHTAGLRDEIADLRRQIEEDNRRLREAQEERDRKLMEALRTLQESKNRRSWFSRLFGR